MIGLLFGLAAGLWAAKWLVLPAAIIGTGVWALAGYLRSCDEVAEADADVDAAAAEIAARADQQHAWVYAGDPRGIYGDEVEHVVTRINAGWYVCDVCGQAGSERWAILHQYPANAT